MPDLKLNITRQRWLKSAIRLLNSAIFVFKETAACKKMNMKTIYVIEKSIGNNAQKIIAKYNYFTQLT